MADENALERFTTLVSRPQGFEDFWQRTKTELAQMPLEPKVSSMPLRSNENVFVYKAEYKSLGGLDIAAWYCVPKQGEGPFPAIIIFPGYKGEPGLRREWGSKGVITLTIAVRGKLRSNSQFNPGYPGLLTQGIEDPETYSYRGVISDCIRGLDFLLSRPEVDSRRIFASGSSQGGGLTLIASALRSEILGGVAGYPFLCCYPEAMEITRSYPYDELVCYARVYPERKEQMMETLRYFDAVNFVSWIKCPMAVGIALEDEVCPPETSYAAFRGLGGPKELWLFPNSGHGNAHDYPAKETVWLEQLIAKSELEVHP